MIAYRSPLGMRILRVRWSCISRKISYWSHSAHKGAFSCFHVPASLNMPVVHGSTPQTTRVDAAAGHTDARRCRNARLGALAGGREQKGLNKARLRDKRSRPIACLIRSPRDVASRGRSRGAAVPSRWHLLHVYDDRPQPRLRLRARCRFARCGRSSTSYASYCVSEPLDMGIIFAGWSCIRSDGSHEPH